MFWGFFSRPDREKKLNYKALANRMRAEYTAISTSDDDLFDSDGLAGRRMGSDGLALKRKTSLFFLTLGALILVVFVVIQGKDKEVDYLVPDSMTNFAVYETIKGRSGSGNFYKRTKEDFAANDSPAGNGANVMGTVKQSTLKLDASITFQTVEGFGGAFTEASANNFYKLPESSRQHLIDLYFGEDGIGLTLGRVHINSCDFSPESYSFDDVADDFELKYFDDDVSHDQATMLPFIREAQVALARSGRELKLIASPWSPPAWMKAPQMQRATRDGDTKKEYVQTMLGSADPAGLLPDRRVHKAWATYITRFVDAYKHQGVKIWAVTPQNEPEFAAPWEACKYNATAESSWINDYLGPILKGANPEILILAFDHNKDHLYEWAQTVMNADRANYVDGLAFHWYAGVSREMDGAYGYENVLKAYNLAPDKLFINTEGCSCPGTSFDERRSWFRAERLGHDIMYDLLHNAHGWVAWNLLVDFHGGPNHEGNNCDAPLVASEDFDALLVQPQFHYLGQFAKFIPPGSRRIFTAIAGDFAFEDTDPHVVVGQELGAYPCEHSQRQVFDMSWGNGSAWGPLSMHASLKPEPPVDLSHEGKMVSLCVAAGSDSPGNRPYVHLTDCESSDVLHLGGQLQSEGDGGEHLLMLQEEGTGLCLTLQADMEAWGMLLRMEECAPSDPHQTFRLTPFGELKPLATVVESQDFCLTAGWPFLSAVAFQTPQDEIVVVVMNEAPVGTSMNLVDEAGLELDLDVPAHAIQSIVYAARNGL